MFAKFWRRRKIIVEEGGCGTRQGAETVPQQWEETEASRVKKRTT